MFLSELQIRPSENLDIAFVYSDHTVKPVDTATSFKLAPPVSGQFWSPGCISNVNEPLLSRHLSNMANSRTFLSQIDKKSALSGHLFASHLSMFQ